MALNLPVFFGELLVGGILIDKGVLAIRDALAHGGDGAAAATGPAGAPGSGGYSALVAGPASFAGPDQGIDFTGAGVSSVLALGDGVVTRVQNTGSGWPGGGMLVYKLTSGDYKGRFVYVAENIRSTLRPGQRVKAGQPVGTFDGAYPGLEAGFSQDAQGTAYGNPHEGKAGAPPDPQATLFQQWVQKLSGPVASAAGAGTGSVSAGALAPLAKAKGWGAGEITSWLAVIALESGGSMTAKNPGSNAYGIAQFINGPGEYAQYGGDVNTQEGQLTAMANYIQQRYGTPSQALAHEHAAGYY